MFSIREINENSGFCSFSLAGNFDLTVFSTRYTADMKGCVVRKIHIDRKEKQRVVS